STKKSRSAPAEIIERSAVMAQAVRPVSHRRVYNEYADGGYERVFTLSENIDRDRIEATLKDGVLNLVLPKAESARARKIELKASAMTHSVDSQGQWHVRCWAYGSDSMCDRQRCRPGTAASDYR
ncbi:MAG TPA: Hsp20 family protein, partial [Xanthobacteraceae bacterium]|nr:Hsp20 family protein [Xanthobacteraceae bacterium]